MAEAFELDRFFASLAPAAITSTSRFVVAPAWRTSTVGIELLLEAYRTSAGLGARFNLIHCVPGLIAYYEKLGCRRFTKNFIRHDTGLNVPMVLAIRDVAHLESVKSPFLAVANRMQSDDRDTSWLLREFPEAAVHRVRRGMSDHEFRSTLLTHGTSDIARASLFAGLSGDEIDAFARNAVVHRFRGGEEIIRNGGSGDEMYVLLQGMVDVVGNEQGRDVIPRTLGPGELVGEMALFNHSRRRATVIAATNVEALVPTHGTLAKAVRIAPELAARVLLNLGTMLADRLQRMSQELTAARASSIVC